MRRPDPDIKRHVPETVTHYLARAGLNAPVEWDRDAGAWAYDCAPWYSTEDEDGVARQVERRASVLPLVVPGLRVVGTGARSRRGRPARHVWFSWSREAMRARFAELVQEHGVPDERLGYRVCSGTLDHEKQRRLPGVVEAEPRTTGGRLVSRSYTRWGLQLIDGGFAHRILSPGVGSPYREWFGNRRCVAGDEWWLAGTRGDSEDVLSLEIRASPLDGRVKENLLHNLRRNRP